MPEGKGKIMERPSIVEDEHLDYLNELRESGETNMLEAVPYLMQEFSLNRKEATEILSYWMESFSD